MGSKRLEGKHAVITGAAGGIAIAAAKAFVAEGACVCLADLDRTGIEKAMAQVASEQESVKAFVMDVTSGKAVEALMSDADAFMGGIDILVTCAGGYNAYAGFEEIDEADWDRVVDVNLKSVYLFVFIF